MKSKSIIVLALESMCSWGRVCAGLIVLLSVTCHAATVKELFVDNFTETTSTPVNWEYGAVSGASSGGDALFVNTTSDMLQVQDYLPLATSSSPLIFHSKTALNMATTGCKIIQLNAELGIGSPVSTQNIALSSSCTVAASSTHPSTPTYSAINVLDGSSSTYWYSNAGATLTASQTTVETLSVTLAATATVSQVALSWDSINYGKDYTIDVSADNSTWKTVVTVTGNTMAGQMLYYGFAPTAARYVRIRITKRISWYAGIGDFKIFTVATGAAGTATYRIGLFDNTSTAYNTGSNSVSMRIDPSNSTNNVQILASDSTGASRTVATFSASLTNSCALALQLDYTASTTSPTVRAYSNAVLIGETTLNGSEGIRLASTGTSQGSGIRVLGESISSGSGGANFTLSRVNVTAFDPANIVITYPQNIALSSSCTVVASSTHPLTQTYSAANVLDGSMSTYWMSNSNGSIDMSLVTPVTVTVTLPSVSTVSQVALSWSPTYYGRDYTVDVSLDNSTWTTVTCVTGNNTTGQLLYYVFNPVSAKYVRVQITRRSSWYAGMGEFRIFQ